MAGATVTAAGHSTRTDADGRFAFVGLAPGTVDVAISAQDVSAPVTSVEIPAGQAVDLVLWAFPESTEDVLIATWSDAVDAEVRVVTAEDARATPGSLGDPVRALHADPALSRTPFDAGWLLVRGGDYDDTATFCCSTSAGSRRCSTRTSCRRCGSGRTARPSASARASRAPRRSRCVARPTGIASRGA